MIKSRSFMNQQIFSCHKVVNETKASSDGFSQGSGLESDQ